MKRKNRFDIQKYPETIKSSQDISFLVPTYTSNFAPYFSIKYFTG